MTFLLLQLLLLFVFFLGLAALSGSRAWRLAIAIIGAIVLAIQTTAVTIGSSLVDYKFYAHFKLDVASQAGGFFGPQVGIVALVLLGSGVLLYWGGGYLRKLFGTWWPGLALALLGLGGISISQGIIPNILEVFSIHFAKEAAFQEALDAAGFTDYVPIDQLRAEPGKNIIALFLESYEIGYLEKLPELTPNLNRLRRRMTYYPMTQNQGGNYTIGALYTYMTGIPMHFKNHGNNVFGDSIRFRLSSVPAVLSRAGYHQEYLAGKPEFAGTDRMWESMGVTVKSEYDFDPKYNVRPWGLHDRDLFTIVESELDRFYASQKPFAYYVSTISTHATDGVADARVDADYPKQASRLELMALALDDYLGRLIDKLEREGRLDNTAIFILPDHLLLSNYSRVLDDFGNERGLFLLTNTESAQFSSGDTINQIHLPGLLLEGAGVTHNLSFLADRLPPDPRAALAERKLPLLQLNEAALERYDGTVSKGNSDKLADQFDLKEDELRLISKGWAGQNAGKPSYVFVGKESIKVRRGINLLTRQDGEFNLSHYDVYQGATYTDSLILAIENTRVTGSDFWLLAHDAVGEGLAERTAVLERIGFPVLAQLKGKRAYLAYESKGYLSEKTNRNTVDATFPRAGYPELRSPEQRSQDARDPDKWIAHAGGAVDGITYPNFLEALDHNYARGFRLFELDIIETSDGHFVAAHDWKHWKNRTGYKGEIPVDRATFLTTPVRKKYTPLDMVAINEWFTAHPDAILISDKVNKPLAFATAFAYPDRLMMELFSFTAVEEARSLGIQEILINQTLLDELEGDKVAALHKLGVGGAAVSIQRVVENPDLYRRLKAAGIKAYAYHIGGYHLWDEAFMARHGLGLVHGLYADEWSLTEE